MPQEPTLIEKLQDALARLHRLEIVTVVGPVVCDSKRAGAERFSLPDGPGAKVMRTTIDLLQGDITTLIDPAFATGELQALREYHGARERQGAQIIRDNVQALLELLTLHSRLGSDHGEGPR